MSLWDEKWAKRLFQILPFYNTFIEKPRIIYWKSIDLLYEIPFYDKLSIATISQTFQRSARNYKIEIIVLYLNLKLINQALKTCLKTY